MLHPPLGGLGETETMLLLENVSVELDTQTECMIYSLKPTSAPEWLVVTVCIAQTRTLPWLTPSDPIGFLARNPHCRP